MPPSLQIPDTPSRPAGKSPISVVPNSPSLELAGLRRIPIANGFQNRKEKHTGCPRRRNGRRPAEADWMAQIMHGAMKRLPTLSISAVNGKLRGGWGSGVRTVTGYLILATTFTNGARTGTPKTTMRLHPNEIRPVPRMELVESRAAVPGATRLKPHALPIAAACLRV